MTSDSKSRKQYWRLAAMLPLMLAAFLSIIGTGDNSDNNLFVCGSDEVSNRNFSEQEPFAFNVGVVNHVELLLNGKNGDITVTGLPGATSIAVSGLKRVLSDSAQDALTHLQQLQVDFRDLTTQALIETDQPRCELGREYIVDYTITLPSFFEVRINNLNGEVAIVAVNDDVSVNNISGVITLTDIAGSAAANLVSGNIVAEMASLPLNGSIDLDVLSGNINLEIPTSTSADFFALVSSGNIDLTNLTLLSPVTTATSVRGILGTGQGVILLETKVLGDIDVLGI